MPVQIVTLRVDTDIELSENEREFKRLILGYPAEIFDRAILEVEIISIENQTKKNHENCRTLGICVCNMEPANA